MRKAILVACMAAVAVLAPNLLAGSRCHPTISGDTHVSVPGHPFSLVSSADGCWVFVSMDTRPDGSVGGVAVIDLRSGSPKLARAIPAPPNVRKLAAIALTHDGRFLMLGTGGGLYVYDVQKTISGEGEPLIGEYVPKQEQPPFYFHIAITANDGYMFASDHASEAVTVFDLKQTRESEFQKFAVVGDIPVGWGPGSVVLSPDERYLYINTQIADDSWNYKKECRAPGAPSNSAPTHFGGALQVVDMSRAVKDPGHAVLTTTPVGCDPVRFILDRSGKRGYVSIRSDDQVLAFDTSRLINDPNHARLASMPTRTGPVGLALIDGGRRLAIANALRFSNVKNGTEGITIIDLKAKGAQLGGLLSPGPVDLGLLPDDQTLVVTNYETEQVSFLRIRDLLTK